MVPQIKRKGRIRYIPPHHATHVTGHPLFPVAKGLRHLPPTKHPLHPTHGPGALAKMPPNLQSAVSEIAKDPTLSAIATGKAQVDGAGGIAPDGGEDHVSVDADHPQIKALPGVVQAAVSSVSGGDTMAGVPTGGSSGTQAQGSFLNPSQGSFLRLPDVRHQVLGQAALVLGAAATGQAKWSPQMRFKGNRVIFPSNLTAGTVSNLLVGTRPQYAAAGAENLDMFTELAWSGIWDLDVCEVGQTITATITTVAAQTVYSAIIGEALDGRAYSLLRSPLKRVAIPSTNVGAGATANIPVTPQVRFKIRKFVTDDATNQNFIINSLNVGINPQLMSGDPVPAAAFGERAIDTWLDCDEAYVGNIVNLNVTNTSGGAANFAGAFLGDVDPRDLYGSV